MFSIDVDGADLAADSNVHASVTATDGAGNTDTATDAQAYTVDTAVSASISIDDITADNIVNAAEAGGTVAVTGTVGGDVEDGDVVTLTVNGTDYTGPRGWRVQHRRCGAALAADSNVHASVTATDGAGNTTTATDTRLTRSTPSVSASISIDDITADNIVNAAEAGGTVAVTGTVGGDVEDGDVVTLTVNGTDYTGPVDGWRVQHRR